MKFTAAITLLFLMFMGAFGWVMNIFAVIGMAGEPTTNEFIIRLVGIPFAFLGAYVGWAW